jgi:hypothetical protein
VSTIDNVEWRISLSKGAKILVYSPDVAEAKLMGDMARDNGYHAVWTASTPEEEE